MALIIHLTPKDNELFCRHRFHLVILCKRTEIYGFVGHPLFRFLRALYRWVQAAIIPLLKRVGTRIAYSQ